MQLDRSNVHKAQEVVAEHQVGDMRDTHLIEAFLEIEGVTKRSSNGMPMAPGCDDREWQWRGPWRKVETEGGSNAA